MVTQKSPLLRTVCTAQSQTPVTGVCGGLLCADPPPPPDSAVLRNPSRTPTLRLMTPQSLSVLHCFSCSNSPATATPAHTRAPPASNVRPASAVEGVVRLPARGSPKHSFNKPTLSDALKPGFGDHLMDGTHHLRPQDVDLSDNSSGREVRRSFVSATAFACWCRRRCGVVGALRMGASRRQSWAVRGSERCTPHMADPTHGTPPAPHTPPPLTAPAHTVYALSTWGHWALCGGGGLGPGLDGPEPLISHYGIRRRRCQTVFWAKNGQFSRPDRSGPLRRADSTIFTLSDTWDAGHLRAIAGDFMGVWSMEPRWGQGGPSQGVTPPPRRALVRQTSIAKCCLGPAARPWWEQHPLHTARVETP